MTTTLDAGRDGGAPVAAPATRSRRARISRPSEARGAWMLLAPYVVLLLVGGIIPVGYALGTSLLRSPTPLDPSSGFGGVDSFRTVVTDFRFADTFLNVFATLVVWLPIMMIGIVGLALLVHASPGRFGSAMRFVYYIPGALAGIANFVLWVYLLNPSQSPIERFWQALGIDTIKQAVADARAPALHPRRDDVLPGRRLVDRRRERRPERYLRRRARGRLARPRQRVAARLAGQAADHPPLDRLRGVDEPGLRLPAVPRAAAARPGVQQRAARPVDAHPARL